MDTNILEWHYVITGTKGSPYHGGHYHGKLKFPPEVRGGEVRGHRVCVVVVVASSQPTPATNILFLMRRFSSIQWFVCVPLCSNPAGTRVVLLHSLLISPGPSRNQPDFSAAVFITVLCE